MKTVDACQHKDRPHYAHGLCRSCYFRQRNAGVVFPKKVPPVVTCGHADIPHQGFGLCERCYAKHRRFFVRPTCHPERPHRTRGLCDECYLAQAPQAVVDKLKDPERNYARTLSTRYGITLDDYYEIVAVQGGRCAICRKTPQEARTKGLTVRRLSLDHDHETGRVRGTLCSDCNVALGLFGDDPEILMKAVAYLCLSPGSNGSRLGRVEAEITKMYAELEQAVEPLDD